MSSLYDSLKHSSQTDRYVVAQDLIHGMQAGDTTASSTYAEICERVIQELKLGEPIHNSQVAHGEFVPSEAIALLAHTERVSGFLSAIQRVPGRLLKVADIGCGATSLLSVAAAVYHPDANVLAYEVNQPSVQCATEVTHLLGLDSRINTIHANALHASIPYVDLLLTETFSGALLTEPGPIITGTLAAKAKEILPRYVLLRAALADEEETTAWQVAARVDLARRNDWIEGTFRATVAGNRDVMAYAGYYDARQDPILVQESVDALTMAQKLGSVSIEAIGDSVNFRYTLGVEPANSEMRVWTQSP